MSFEIARPALRRSRGLLITFVLCVLAPALAVAEDEPNGTPSFRPDLVEFDAFEEGRQLRLVEVDHESTPATVIDITLDEYRPVRLEVLDDEGDVVRTIADGLFAEGEHRMAWLHDDEEGLLIPDGEYTVRLTAGPETDPVVAKAR